MAHIANIKNKGIKTMRIAFCGKGGSGKTSLATLFIRYLESQNLPVLAIDGDINQHLGTALGFDTQDLKTLSKLGQRQDIMTEYLRGTNPRIRAAGDMIESTPAGTGSNLINRAGTDPVSAAFMLKRASLHFVAVGGHEEHDIGATCFHKFTGAEGIFLNHYLDAADEYVVADMCAGADPFSSSGLATRYDACIVVLEPTQKSIAVYHQARHYGDPHGVKITPVANKIMSDDDQKFIEEQIGEPVLCAFGLSNVLRMAERGQDWAINDIEPQTLAGLKKIQSLCRALPPRNWTRYQEIGNLFHKRACDGWASAMYGHDLMEQIDPDFTYPQMKMAEAA